MNNTQWNTNVKYVDIETGEELSKAIAISDYIIKSKKTNSVKNNVTNKGVKYIIYECKKSSQLKLI